jgi:choline-glycine betaine transporter
MSGFDEDWIVPLQEEHIKKCWNIEVGRKGSIGHIKMNPVVSIFAALLMWTFVIVILIVPNHMLFYLNQGMGWVADVWCWIYIASQNIWVLALIYVAWKFGHIKLGKDEEQPIFSDISWFSMLFSAGVAVGLVYFVAEPMWHAKGYGGPRFIGKTNGYHNDNDNANLGMVVTWYHWGIHGWIPYTTVGALLGLLAYRRGFPLSCRFGLYPLIGNKVYGWIGDLFDVLTIVTTIMGVCTSLGLGTMSINIGMQRLSWNFYRGVSYNVPDENRYMRPGCQGTGNNCDWIEGRVAVAASTGVPAVSAVSAFDQEGYGVQTNTLWQTCIIVAITLLATISVMSGMKKGIVMLSRMAFGLGCFLLFFILFAGDTWYMLNLFTQALGYYIWYLPRLAMYSDAMELLGGKEMGRGGAPDGKGGSAGWMNAWTIFYWGWWISWGPFVGTFMAKISRGRTLRQFIIGTLIVPSLYAFFWFACFGGEALRIQRIADTVGLCGSDATKCGLKHVDMACTSADPAYCGRKPGNCNSYAGAFSPENKKTMGMGFTPSCVLQDAGIQVEGKCKKFEWKHHAQVGSECVEVTTWVDTPCGKTTADPTAMTALPCAGLTGTALKSCKANKKCFGVINQGHLDNNFNHFPMEKNPECFTPVDDGIVCLWYQATASVWFDLMDYYMQSKELSFVGGIISLITLILYFVTSSDSGSLIVDIIAANGDEEPPMLQRVFWALTEGACAIALLYSGVHVPGTSVKGEGGLRALQAGSIIMGLPYTFVLFWFSQALVQVAREEGGDLDPERPRMIKSIFDMPRDPLMFVRNTFAPGFSPAVKVACKDWPFGGFVWQIIMQVLYVMVVTFLFVALASVEWLYIAASLYIGYSGWLSLIRRKIREECGIPRGDFFTDFFCALLMPMFTLGQLEVQITQGGFVEKGSAGAPPQQIGGSYTRDV